MPMGLDAQRAASARSNRKALLVILSTAVGGILAFSLINDTRVALIGTALIGLSALVTRVFDNGSPATTPKDGTF
jgi:hypothetical protein